MTTREDDASTVSRMTEAMDGPHKFINGTEKPGPMDDKRLNIAFNREIELTGFEKRYIERGFI